jgi:hypothetical protein
MMMMMMKRSLLAMACSLLITVSAIGQTPGVTTERPNIDGEWTGTWGTYSPSQGAVPPKDICKSLGCKVTYKDGVWEASFEGDCGRPYKYTIKMEGRQIGKVVMFKGTTDLGAKDGGVFDWIGRATEKEFVGFFTSAYYTGVFNLSRTK